MSKTPRFPAVFFCFPLGLHTPQPNYLNSREWGVCTSFVKVRWGRSHRQKIGQAPDLPLHGHTLH